MARFNRHHELFTRRDFEAKPHTRQLRNHDEFIVPMELEAHQELHEDCLSVPAFSDDEARKILNLMDWRGNYLENIEQLIMLIDRVVARRVGELAIANLKNQIPYITDGAYSLDMNRIPPRKHKNK